jgi:hypothetical protein
MEEYVLEVTLYALPFTYICAFVTEFACDVQCIYMGTCVVLEVN